MMRDRLIGLICVLVALALHPAAAHADIYDPPSPLPPGVPGDVIRAEPTEAKDSGGQRLPAKAWRVLYRSTSATGGPIAVSGTILVPEEASAGARPVVAYSIGTRGIADRCAPSRNIPTGGEPRGQHHS